MLTTTLAKIDKFYYLFGLVILVVLIIVFFVFRVIYGSFTTAYQPSPPEKNVKLDVNKLKMTNSSITQRAVTPLNIQDASVINFVVESQ